MTFCKARALTEVRILGEELFSHALYYILSLYVYVMRLAGIMSKLNHPGRLFFIRYQKKGGNTLTAGVIRGEDGFSEGQQFGYYKNKSFLDKNRPLKL